jgi:Tfp pilus assembly protein PilX
MKARNEMRNRRRESGIALLIAIFVLLLISVVGIALIVSSGTESALAGNYRSSTGVYYAALAGLEEARGRLLARNPNSFLKTAPANFLPAPGTQWDIGYVRYVLNPGPADAADTRTAYQDAEYDTEFGANAIENATGAGTVATTQSVWNIAPLNALPVPGPLYKWVRINPISEVSLGRQVAPYGDGHTADATKPIYYDGTLLTVAPTGAREVLEITSLAVLPNNSQKIVQYLVAPAPLSLNLPAALTLDGNNPQFTASPSASFYVKGIDQGSAGTCNPGPTPSTAVGYTDTSYTQSNFETPSNPQGIPAGLLNNYMNGVASNPDIVNVSGTLSPNLQTVGGLNSLIQTIQQNADVVVNGNATGANMPAAMSATNPMTIVINGDLVFSGWRETGYGLLLVTGEFTYDPDASWDGIILVIGKGWMYSHQGAYTNTQIQGAVFLARTLDASGNPLPPSSAPIFTAASSGFDFHSTPNTLTTGIYYSNCWIQAAMPSAGYQVLSFHEIASQ